MSEQATCHEWLDGFWDADTMIPRVSGYCPTCGIRLNADGTVTRTVEADAAAALEQRAKLAEKQVELITRDLGLGRLRGACASANVWANHYRQNAQAELDAGKESVL